MTHESLQHAQHALATLHDTLEQHAIQSGPRLFVEPFLMQTLVVVAEFLPESLENSVRAIIDLVRQFRGVDNACPNFSSKIVPMAS